MAFILKQISAYKNNVALCGLFLAFFALLIYSVPSLAQQGITEPEKVGFAFYKLGDLEPDFNSWVRETDGYKYADDKEDYLRREMFRLENFYYNYLPDQDLINVSLDVKVKIMSNVERKAMNAKGEETPVRIELKDTPEGYIPFFVAGTWIAIIPSDFEKHSIIFMNQQEFGTFKTRLGFDPVSSQDDALLEVILRPLAVDTQQPMQMGTANMWLMLAEIASMELWREGKKRFVWRYDAPWYVTEEQTDLLRLYED